MSRSHNVFGASFVPLIIYTLRRFVKDVSAYGFRLRGGYRHARNKPGNRKIAVIVRLKDAVCGSLTLVLVYDLAFRGRDLELRAHKRRVRQTVAFGYGKASLRAVIEYKRLRLSAFDFHGLRHGIENIAAYGSGFLYRYRNAGIEAGNQNFAVAVRDEIAERFAVRIGDMECGSGNRRCRVRDKYPYRKALFRGVPEGQLMRSAAPNLNILGCLLSRGQITLFLPYLGDN